MTPIPLETLFQRYRDQHDLTALAQVFDRTAPQLLALARRLSGGLAEDLVQETFLAVIDNSGAWDIRKPLAPWLLGILTHRAQRAWAKESRTIDTERLTVREVQQPDEALAASELHAQVEHALMDLTPALQQAVRGSLYDGKSPTQLAADLGLDSGTIRQRLFRGMSQLRLQLKGALLALFALFGLRSQGLAAVRKQVLQEATRASVGGAVGFAAISIPARVATVLIAATLCWVGAAALWSSSDSSLAERDGAGLVGLRPDPEVESQAAAELVSTALPTARTASSKRHTLEVQLVWDTNGEAIHGREIEVSLRSGEKATEFSGLDGKASFPYTPGDRPWQLSAKSTSEGLGLIRFLGNSDPKETMVIRLSKGGSLSGIVVDAQGDPVPNAAVIGWSEYRKGRVPDRSAVADSKGNFTVQYLGKRFKLIASSEDLVCWKGLHGAAQVGDELVDHKIELTMPVAYVGRVLSPQGEPLAGAKVETTDVAWVSGRRGKTHDSSVKSFLAGEGVTTTDEQGNFVLSGLPPGVRPMSVRSEPFLVLREDEVSNDGPIEFTLDPGGAIDGNVLGRNGETIPGVQVSYWPQNDWFVTTPKWITPDPKTGRFAIRGIKHYEGFRQDPSDRNRGVIFRAPGYAVKLVIPLPDDISELSPLIVRLNPEQRIEGRVVDSDGLPQEGLRVRVEGKQSYESNMHDGLPNTWEKLIEKNVAYTDAKGEFSFGELYSGEFTVRAYSGSSEQGAVFKQFDSGGDFVELVMDRENLRGVVILPIVTDERTGTLIKDFTLVQWVGDSGHFRVATQGENGPEVVGLDPGIWGIGIKAEGYMSERLPNEDFEMGEYPVNFQLCPKVDFEVQVLMPDGSEGAYVNCRGTDSDGTTLWFVTEGSSKSSSGYLTSTTKHLRGLPARQVNLSFQSGRFEASVSMDLSKTIPKPLVVHLQANGPEPVWVYVAAWELVPYEPKENVRSKSIIQPMALAGLPQEEATAFFKGLDKVWFEEPIHPFSVSVDGPTGEGIFTMEYEILEADDPELVKWRKGQLARDNERRQGNPHDDAMSEPRDLLGAQLRLTTRYQEGDSWSSTVSYPMVNRHKDDDEDTVFALEGSFPTIPGECRLHLTSDYYKPIEITWNPGQRQAGDPIPLLFLVPKLK